MLTTWRTRLMLAVIADEETETNRLGNLLDPPTR